MNAPDAVHLGEAANRRALDPSKMGRVVEDAAALPIRHRFCPSCGSQSIGHQMLGESQDEDPNTASCGDCGCTWGALRRQSIEER